MEWRTIGGMVGRARVVRASRETIAMNVLSVDDASATVEISFDESAILYSCIVEAVQALSAAEFRIRVGRSVSDAETLRVALKPDVTKLQGL